jgi:hypothetical protein
MRTSTVVTAVLCVAVVGLAVWVTAARTSAGPEWLRGQGTSAAMEAWIRSAESGNELDLRSVVHDPWDYYVVFSPYTSREEIDQVLGFEWEGSSHTRIHESDGIALIVFVRGKEVSCAFEHPRGEGDLASGAVPNGVRLTEPTLRLANEANGWRVLGICNPIGVK